MDQFAKNGIDRENENKNRRAVRARIRENWGIFAI